MARFLKKQEAKKGLPPGSLVHVGNRKIEHPRVRVIDYDRSNLDELELEDIGKSAGFKNTNTVSWINIDGVHDADIIQSLGDMFGLHPLVLEDVMNTGQRPKVDDYDDYLFVVLKMLRYDDAEQLIVAEQLSLVLGDVYLITFQEQPGDVFEPVRERIRKQKGRIRGNGAGYLAYALLDTIVDNYMYLIERLGERIEDLEDEILAETVNDVLDKINTYKSEISFVRKSVRPARELIVHLARLDSEQIDSALVPYLKDLEDLTLHTVEAIDAYRDMLSDQLQIYQTNVSNRMNEIMKVLTIFAAIFIPLTFIAGIYGTNFEYLPELQFRYSYFAFWGFIIVVAGIMLYYFRKKRWL